MNRPATAPLRAAVATAPRAASCFMFCCVAVAASLCGAQQPSPEPQAEQSEAAAEAAVDLDLLVAPEQRPRIDRVKLNDDTQTVLEVLPLDLPGRELPLAPEPGNTLTLYLASDPNTAYKLQWRHVAHIELFEQAVLADAQRLVEAGQFDEAYGYYRFLQRYYPTAPGLKDAEQAYLAAESAARREQGNYEHALALLTELHALNPGYEGLGQLTAEAVEPLFEQHLAAGRYATARELAEQLSRRFPTAAAEAALADRLAALAGERMQQAEAALAAGQQQQAAAAVDEALAIWPRQPGLAELVERIYGQYARVKVGVTESAAADLALNRWSARRTARLVERQFLELVAIGPEGGQYICPLGDLELEDLNRRLHFTFHGDGAEALVTGYGIARQFMRLFDRHDVAWQPRVAAEFSGLTVPRPQQLTLDLARLHVRPEALLQSVLLTVQRRTLRPLVELPGPYLVAERSGGSGSIRFRARGDYFAHQPGQPQEVVEQHYASADEALAALRSGELHVVDRLQAWQVARITREDRLRVIRYATPTMHCLLTNPQRPLTAQRSFRRGLLYGIDRETILRDVLLEGASGSGCQVISAPLPAGVGLDDPLRYAYDATIAPRPYDPNLALALCGAGLRQAGDDAPSLTLAHPSTDTARRACQAISAYLARVGIEVQLQPWEPGQPPPAADGEFDLIYAEIAIAEPCIDVPRVLGSDGLARWATPVMQLALRRLHEASSWSDVRQRLHDIHRLAHDELTIIPLWQLTEHLAYRPVLAGIEERPISLYQHVEQWRLAPPQVAERRP